MRLAFAEVYLAIVYLFRRLGTQLQLQDTEYKRDVAFVQDYFIPAPSKGSKGVRVVKREDRIAQSI